MPESDSAAITLSVIARMESNNAKTLPRIDILRRIMSATGYETIITAKKGRFAVKAAL